nr:MAG TPA: hypothetical protein [Caudoviricetes sp.]
MLEPAGVLILLIQIKIIKEDLIALILGMVEPWNFRKSI